MNACGLIGYPLGHSLSLFIHAEIFKRNSVNADYKLYEIAPENFHVPDSLTCFNITIPYKERIIPYCDELDVSAECGAVNCVKARAGYNTDIYGFEKSVEALSTNIGKGSRVCLLGFGGAGRMAAHCVEKAGGTLTVVRRGGKPKGNYDLIINATPVGMYPNIDASPIDFKDISSEFVLDLVYNPLKTKLLTLAEAAGAKVMNGLPMLVWQAAKSHEIWYGGTLSEEDVKEIANMAEGQLQ